MSSQTQSASSASGEKSFTGLDFDPTSLPCPGHGAVPLRINWESNFPPRLHGSTVPYSTLPSPNPDGASRQGSCDCACRCQQQLYLSPAPAMHQAECIFCGLWKQIQQSLQSAIQRSSSCSTNSLEVIVHSCAQSPLPLPRRSGLLPHPKRRI